MMRKPQSPTQLRAQLATTTTDADNAADAVGDADHGKAARVAAVADPDRAGNVAGTADAGKVAATSAQRFSS
jgi:hypothetical protein